MQHVRLFILLFAVTISKYAASQDSSSISSLSKLSSKYFENVASKLSGIENGLTGYTQKSLRRLKKEEEKLKKKLSKIDSSAANNLFNNGIIKYNEFEKQLTEKAEKITQFGVGNYIPYLDTLKSTIGFLQQNSQRYSGKLEGLPDKLAGISSNINDLESRLHQVKAIQQYLKERRQYLKQQLAKYGLEKHIKKMSKEVYYVGQLLKDYKEILKDPKKAEQKALAILREIPAFKKFMQKNSMLASIFRVPTDNSSSQGSSLMGLQTRASVQQYIQASLPMSGANPNQFLTQQLQSANGQMASMKNMPRLLEVSDNLGEVPDFKPNSEKTKSFFKRLEYSTNIQFGKTNGLMPTTGDFSLGVGYKLNSNGIIGIGTSYKLGLGSIRNIRFTHQGFAIRSYIDWQVKAGIYISGGYEKNILPGLRDLNITTRTGIVEANQTQESGLIGISKKYPINKKLKGSAQILFDFLSYKNIPKSQPILVRFGWSF